MSTAVTQKPVPAGDGTSTKVAGPVRYPSWSVFLVHVLWHLRGSFLAALFTVYVACGPYGFPALLQWFHSDPTVARILTEPAASKWLRTTFFSTTRTDGKTYEDAILWTLLTVGVHLLLYIVVNGFFGACDIFGFLQRYKLPRTPRMRLTRGLVVSTLREAFVNQLVTGPIVVFLIYVYVARFRSMYLDRSVSGAMVPTPALPSVWFHLAMASLVNEILFYIAHRAFHEVPGLYVRFHKQHHRYVGSIGIAAEYAHPLEQVLANQGPTAAYMLFNAANIDQSVWFVWLAWRLLETYEAHSGYSFTGSWLSKLGFTYGERARFHDWHHSDNRGCYGVFWIDYLCGTMDSFAQHLEATSISDRQKKVE
jgi:sterol desaturase/sphingolipid hydroxylase (fatty acid hydroxylase superfamily)